MYILLYTYIIYIYNNKKEILMQIKDTLLKSFNNDSYSTIFYLSFAKTYIIMNVQCLLSTVH